MQVDITALKNDILNRLEQISARATSKEHFLRKTFKYFDLYETQQVSRENFNRAMEKLGVYINSKNRDIIDNRLFNGKKEINYIEFIDLVIHERKVELESSNIYTNRDYLKSLSTLETKMNQSCLLTLFNTLCAQDMNKSGQVDYNGLMKAASKCGFGELRNDIRVAFDALDKNLNRKIEYLDFINLILSELNENRVHMLNELFNFLAVSGKITFYGLTNSWDLTKHPDVRNGIRSQRETEDDFVNGLKNYMACLRVSNNLDSSIFKGFFKFVGSPIKNDNYFKLLLERVFSIKLSNLDHESMSLKTFMTESNISSKYENISKKYKNVRSDTAENVIKKLLNILLERGLKNVLTFISCIYSQDKMRKNRLIYEQFERVFEDFRIQLTKQELIDLFKFFQKNNFNEYMTITTFHERLIGKLTLKRQKAVAEVYGNLIKNGNDILKFHDINVLYKGYNSNETNIASFVKKTDFVECVGIYCNLMHYTKEIFTQDLFIDFFRYISLFFLYDKDFEQYLDLSWRKHFDSQSEGRKYKYNEFENSYISKSTPYGVYSGGGGVNFMNQKNIDKSEVSVRFKEQGIAAGKSKVQPKEEEQGRRNIRENDIQNVISRIKKEGGFTFLLFKENIKKIDFQGNKNINTETFSSTLEKTYRQVLKKDEIDKLADYLSKGRKTVFYENFYKQILAPLDKETEDVISRLFTELDIFKVNCVVYEMLKNKFRALSHPSVQEGKKMKYEVHKEFMDNLDMYCQLYLQRTRKGTFEFRYEELCDLFNHYLLDVERVGDGSIVLEKCFKL